MAPLAGQLVGRADELGAIERLFDELDQGRPAAIELAGEPGIGKTRLLKEVGVRAEARGFLVLSGAAAELESDLPFSVFVDALDAYVAGLEPTWVAQLDEQVQAELAHVFPSLSALGRGRDVALQQERYRSHRAVRELLSRLARPRPLMLVLDDVHWADSASVELLNALLRRPPVAAVLIAIAVRPRQTPERLSAPLERAQREGLLTRIGLGALSRVEARAFLGEALNPAEAAALYEESGGNPFYLQQLAWAVAPTNRVASAAPGVPPEIGVPPAVAAALTGELASLSEGSRRLLDGAAVAGDPFDLQLAAAAAAMSEDATLDAVDELLPLDLIREADMPRRFRFRHPLVRRAVYETTRAGWRLRAHERCAAALAKRGATAAERAHHMERSARQGDAAAIAVLREAGEAAARLAPASAARWLGAALGLLPENAPREERLALLLERARSLAAIGRFADSHADLLLCVDIATREAREWRVRAATACASVEHLLGLQTEAHRHLATALVELGGAQSAEAVELMIELSLDGFQAGDFGAMRNWAGRAVVAATAMGERPLLAAALSVRAWAGAMAGGGEQARAHCEEATELVDDLSDEEVARRLDALAHLTGADIYLDRFPAATRHAQRALEIGRATGQGDLFPLVVEMLGTSLWVQGRPLEAEELLDGAVEAARLVDNVQSLAWTLFNRSLAALAAGNIDVALATAQEAHDLEEGMEQGAVSAGAAAVFASALLEAGQPDRSIDLLLSGVGGEELRLMGGGWRAWFLEVLTRALLATGRRAEAERAAATAQACADEVALPSAAASAGMAAAAIALHAGQPTIAVERALAAAKAFESVEALWDAARAGAFAGRAFARAGEPDRAARHLELAAAAFESFGSLRYRDQAERELRKLGRHLKRRTRVPTKRGPGLASLTARELQIARLVTDRKTNVQIAAELFLSPKTVETHLRNVFNKVGVETRVDLARAIERVDRAPTASAR